MVILSIIDRDETRHSIKQKKNGDESIELLKFVTLESNIKSEAKLEMTFSVVIVDRHYGYKTNQIKILHHHSEGWMILTQLFDVM